MEALDRFTPGTKAWFQESFAAPTPAQVQAWERISAGLNVLVSAPTGSGKTLAAFLWAIDSQFRAAAAVPVSELSTEHKVRVIYISPLKALAVDVERNLRIPLHGVTAQTRALGLPIATTRIGVRTGDTPPEERRRFIREPPDILITTPESFYLLLTSAARENLGSVETVIIDEIHAVANTKRGAHLALSLERLDELAERPVQRIGLSATVRPLQTVADFLSGVHPVEIVAPPAEKKWQLDVVVPMPQMGKPTLPQTQETAVNDSDSLPEKPVKRYSEGSIWPATEERIFELICQHRSTLIFVNFRGLAERMTSRLNELAQLTGIAPDVEWVRAHHGSVSYEQRSEIEEGLKSGQLRAVVSTSSLELGIDMGAIDLVIQVESPPSVAAGLQRIGRAGHQVGAVSHGMFFPKYQGDLLQTAVVTMRMKAGAIEELKIISNPLDVLAQQIVAMVAMDPWHVDALEQTIRRCANFKDLTRPVLNSVLEMLAGHYPSDDFGTMRPRLNWDQENDLLTGRRGAQRLAVTNGGTIPDRGLFGVFLADGVGPGRRVGELDEEMVYETRIGDVFALGTSTWRVERITHDQVLVSPAPGEPARIPFWHGYGIGRPAELGQAIGEFTRKLESTDTEQARQDLIAAGLDVWATDNLLTYLAEEKQISGFLPTDRQIVLQRHRDEVGDWRLIVLSPFGDRVHAPWALLAAARLREQFKTDVKAMHGDDGIVFRIPDTAADWEASDWFELSDDALLEAIFPPPDDVLAAITEQLSGSALFTMMFRESANRALLLPKRRPNQRRALWQQRLQAVQLLEVANEYPSFPMIMEAVRECLNDVFDVPALTRVLAGVKTGEIKAVSVNLPQPSPFTSSLLMGYIMAFMYEYDAPLAERKAAALSLDPQLLAQLLGTVELPSLSELLDQTQLTRTALELQHLTDTRKAQDADELTDLLRWLGPLTTDELGARCRWPEAVPAWLTDLESQGRVFSHGDMWVERSDVDTSLERWVLRYARTHVPFTFTELATWLERVNFPTDCSCQPQVGEPPLIECQPQVGVSKPRGTDTASLHVLLADLVRARKLIEGEMRPPGWTYPQLGAIDTSSNGYVDPTVLQTLRRRSIAALRNQIEPVSPLGFARFLPSWHEFGERTGTAGVLRSIEQLAGVPIPASAWETFVLPSRVRDYHRSMLDGLLADGEICWQGNGMIGNGDCWISFHLRENVTQTLRSSNGEIGGELEREILGLLGSGARFSADIATQLDHSVSGVEAALWELAWAGLVSNDSFSGVRSFLQQGATAHQAKRTALSSRGGRQRLRLRRPLTGDLGRTGGRWWAMPQPDLDPTTRAVTTAELLLDRYPVLTRGAVIAEDIPGKFSGIYGVLSAAEEAGQLRRGYFIDGLGATQFAQAIVVDRLREIANQPQSELHAVTITACDPANPYGAALDWPSRHVGNPGRKPGALVVLVAGELVLYIERGGRTALTWSSDATVLAAAAASLRDSIRRVAMTDLTIEKVDGIPILEGNHPLAAALTQADFKMTPRGLTLRSAP